MPEEPGENSRELQRVVAISCRGVCFDLYSWLELGAFGLAGVRYADRRSQQPFSEMP